MYLFELIYDDYFFVSYKCEDSLKIYPSSFLMKGCYNIWAAVILFEGSHLRHSLIKSIPSGGQLGKIVYKGIGKYSGKLIPFLAACFKPSGQFFGVPSTEVILLI